MKAIIYAGLNKPEKKMFLHSIYNGEKVRILLEKCCDYADEYFKHPKIKLDSTFFVSRKEEIVMLRLYVLYALVDKLGYRRFKGDSSRWDSVALSKIMKKHRATIIHMFQTLDYIIDTDKKFSDFMAYMEGKFWKGL